jgi:hypothetical protein
MTQPPPTGASREAPGSRPRSSRPSGMEPRWLLTSRLLVIALLAITSSGCCPSPTQPYTGMRVPCGELTDILPYWRVTADARPDFAGLKTAAITLARASESERRAMIAEHSRAYCILYETDQSRASGLFLLMRVLFVLPPRHPKSDTQVFGSFCRRDEWYTGSERDISWPVHEDPQRHVLEIDRIRGCFQTGYHRGYDALAEYDYFRERFDLRTPAEIEALTIRVRP